MAVFLLVPAPGYSDSTEIPEAIVLPKGPYTGVPEELLAGIEQLMPRLQDIKADNATVAAATEFLEFLEDNPGLTAKEIVGLTNRELDELSAGLKHGANALAVLGPLSKVLSDQKWLTQVNPVLAENIRRECGRRTVTGVDIYRSMELLLADPESFEGDAENLLEDVDGVARECIENMQQYASLAARSLLVLDEEIVRLNKAIEEARAKGDEELAKRLEAKRESAEEQKREIEKGLDLASLIKLIVGLSRIVSGVSAIVASGGSCVPCYAEVALGAAAVVDGWNELNGGEPAPAPATQPARRPAINPNAEPTDAARKDALAGIAADPGLTYIEPNKPGGNYLVAVDMNGDLVVTQIEPLTYFRLPLTSAVKDKDLSDAGTVEIADLAKVNWTGVVEIPQVSKTQSVVVLDGRFGGLELRAVFTENPVDTPVMVTVETR